MEGSHKLKNFDYHIKTMQKNLRFKEKTGKKKPIVESHGDYVKSLAVEGKVICKWILLKENIADIMTKPLRWRSHNKSS